MPTITKRKPNTLTAAEWHRVAELADLGAARKDEHLLALAGRLTRADRRNIVVATCHLAAGAPADEIEEFFEGRIEAMSAGDSAEAAHALPWLRHWLKARPLSLDRNTVLCLEREGALAPSLLRRVVERAATLDDTVAEHTEEVLVLIEVVFPMFVAKDSDPVREVAPWARQVLFESARAAAALIGRDLDAEAKRKGQHRSMAARGRVGFDFWKRLRLHHLKRSTVASRRIVAPTHVSVAK